MDVYTVRAAKPEQQRELTRLCVRATMHAGHDEAFIDRTMPALTIAVPLISANCVQVAQDSNSEVVGVVVVTPTGLQGIAQLYGLYVDPAHWKRGIGRVLFDAALARAKEIKAGALMITAEPSAEGFYKRMGAIRIGERTVLLLARNHIAFPPVRHSSCQPSLDAQPDMQISRIRLSDKTSRLHPRLAAAACGQAYEPEVPVKVLEWINPALASPDLVLGAQPPAQPRCGVVVERPIRRRDGAYTEVVRPAT